MNYWPPSLITKFHNHHFTATAEEMVWEKAVVSFLHAPVSSMPQCQHPRSPLWMPLLLPDNSCSLQVPGWQQPAGIWFCSWSPCWILGFNLQVTCQCSKWRMIQSHLLFVPLRRPGSLSFKEYIYVFFNLEAVRYLWVPLNSHQSSIDWDGYAQKAILFWFSCWDFVFGSPQ